MARFQESGGPEPSACHADVGRADSRHKRRRNHRDQISQPLHELHQISSRGPQHKHGKSLVRPSEIPPDDIEPVLIGDVVPKQQPSDQKQRNVDHKPVGDRFLIQMQEIRHNQACASERCVPARDRSGDHTKDGQNAT